MTEETQVALACHLCEKYKLTQRADAKTLICPDCGLLVCEDCTADVVELSEVVAPDTEPLVRGVIQLCLDCAEV